jgi:hypothetical protein
MIARQRVSIRRAVSATQCHQFNGAKAMPVSTSTTASVLKMRPTEELNSGDLLAIPRWPWEMQ